MNRNLVLLAIVCLLSVPQLVRAEFAEQLFQITASDGSPGDRFGSSIGVDGDRVIVGAVYGDDVVATVGAAYVYDASTNTELSKLAASDGEIDDELGRGVAVRGNYALVGAQGDSDYMGAAYLFDVTSGNQLAKFTPSNGTSYEYFGSALALSDTKAFVGAFGHDEGLYYSGSVFVYDLASGAQLARLTPDDARSGGEFGRSVAVSGNTAIIGAAGAAYLFDVETGTQLAKITSDDADSSDLFGCSVDISGNIAIVGAWAQDLNGVNSGAAYLFDITTGNQLAELIASDGAGSARFGSAVAIDGDLALVGSYRAEDQGASLSTCIAIIHGAVAGGGLKMEVDDVIGPCFSVIFYEAAFGSDGSDGRGPFAGREGRGPTFLQACRAAV